MDRLEPEAHALVNTRETLDGGERDEAGGTNYYVDRELEGKSTMFGVDIARTPKDM